MCIQIYIAKVAHKNYFYLTQDNGDVPKKSSAVIRSITENQLLIQLCEIIKLLMQYLEISFRLYFNYSQKVSLDILY